MRRHLVLRVVVIVLLSPLLLFACYVQAHGDYSPGGGFQAGALLATTLFLYGLVFGDAALDRALSPGFLRVGAAIGVALYLGVGLASLVVGGAFLDYGALSADPRVGRHWGVALVELGVGITVACVLTMLFQCFAADPQAPDQRGRGRESHRFDPAPGGSAGPPGKAAD